MSHHRERGTWAPFVGVALAALTIGSLVLFSVIAQRTAGGAFVSGGISALTPAQEAAGSITVATAAGGGGSALASERTATEVADAVASPTSDLFTPAPTEDLDAPLVATGDAPDIATTTDADPSERVASTEDLRPFFRMAAGGPDNGEVFAANRGKNANGEGKGSKGSKSSKAKHPKGPKATGRARDRADHGSDGRSGSGGATASAKASGPALSARPAASSRPGPKASNHPNQRGKGHSKGRGRGRRH